MSTREAIDKTIDDLRKLVERAVRDEQLRHWLTGLPNASALTEHIQHAIGGNEPFWLAFIEIDKFKSINDQFGYERANVLLAEVAQSLEQTAPRFFANQAVAFHAHGDEFYVLGRASPTRFTRDEVAQKLDAIRDAIANIALTGTEAGLMQCTASIGWRDRSAGTAYDLMHDLEIAVAHAKRRGRNRVVMYDESMRKAPVISLRSECSRCETSFSFEVPTAALHDGNLFCPNCGTQGPRPAHAARAPGPQDITDLPPAASHPA
jgi:diguanylate cyclase (GGDEF)-like protein